jgi:thiol-disulfide isomerase/thioredoxin
MKHALYFTADWCGPCKRVRPIVEEINKDSQLKFKVIDADDNIDLCKTFSITSIPTFILLEDNVEIKRLSGAKTKTELEDFLNG